MDKEEILAKSREENEIADECARYVGMKGANFSISVLVILWIVLSRLAPLNDAAKYAMGLLVTTTCFSNFAYQFTQNRTKTVVLFTALFFAAALAYLALFLRFGLEVFGG